MKKSLVALAALAATTAFAQSSVTLYGNLDQGLYNNSDSGKSQSSISSNIGSTSTLGFRGNEDLGGGLSANFNLLSELSLKEGQVGSSTSGNTATTGQKTNLFTRAAYIALKSTDIGEVQVGRIQDLVWQTGGALNNTNLNSFGWATLTATSTNSDKATGQGIVTGLDSADKTFSGTSGASGTANSGAIGLSPYNFAGGIQYAAPKLLNNQLQITAATYGAAFAGAKKNGAGVGYRIEYTSGPLAVNYAVSNRNDTNEQKGMEVTMYGATYQAGPYKLVGAQAKTKFFNNMADLHDLTVTGLGIIYDLNAKTDLALGYTTLKDDEDSTTKTTLVGVTARYKFSARTLAYAGYGSGKNTGTNNKQTMFYGGPSAGNTAAGVTSSGILVGLRHSF